jgi:dihydrofolate reductase
MRKIIAAEFMSLDGVIDSANQLTGQYFNDELQRYLAAGMAGTDTLLMGRVTYQEFVPVWADKTGTEDPVAAHMSKPKYVVSTTLTGTSEWPNSTLVKGNPAEQLSSLKEQPGKDILALGSATLVRWLLREGLADELDLLIFPVIIGRGKRLFDGDGSQIKLKLADAQVFSTGVVHLTYQPASGDTATEGTS